MMKTISLVVMVSFFMSGCAAMFNGTSETINLRSEEADTQFFVNNNEIGKGTSATTSLPKKNLKTAVLRAEKPGCTPQSSLIETAFDPTTLLGLIIDCGVISILVVDWAATGAITKADQRNYILTPKCPK
jgi:hypothetical protein